MFRPFCRLMLVFGDATRVEQASNVLDELGQLAEAADEKGVPWIVRHAQLTNLFIRAGELVQGLADAEYATCAADSLVPEAQTRAKALSGLAAFVMRSWTQRSTGGAAELTSALETLRGACPDASIRIKQPEGYACYAVYPEAYGLAAAELAAVSPVVIGLRSIGVSLGAMVAARTGSPLLVSLRPSGDPFRRAPRLAPDLKTALRQRRFGRFAIVDEGPGLSGSSMAGVAATLEGLGVTQSHIHFLPSHRGLPGSAASNEVRARWLAAPRHVVTFDDLALRERGEELASWVEDLTGKLLRPLQDVGGGRWRDFHEFGDRPPGGGPRERRKFLLTAKRGVFLLRFVGLGCAGAAALRRAQTLSDGGFAPPVFGLRHGFLVERWLVDARPFDPVEIDRTALIVRLSEYLAFRARRLPAAMGEGASLTKLARMAARNSELLLGRPVDLQPLVEVAEHLSPRLRRVQTDNRLHCWEWLRLPDRRLIKTDAVDHCAGHELVGCQDVAWDVAGAAIEFGLSAEELAELCGRLAAHGLAVHQPLLRFYKPCYLAFQAGGLFLDVAASALSEDRRILAQHLRRYGNMLSRCDFSKSSPEPSL